MTTFPLALAPGALSAILAFLFTPVVIKIAWKLGLIDDPRGKTHPKILHKTPTPRAGGLATYAALVICALIFLPFDKHLAGILIGATLLVVLGLLDDKYNLSPYLRLFVQFAAAAIPISTGIGVSFLTNPLGGTLNLPPLIADVFALFWIVTIMNFLNFGAKGVDGQLPGVVVIAAVVITALSSKFSADITQWSVIILASITAGAYLGFLPWNMYPQKIMPGMSGSNVAGYMLAVLSILSTTKVGTLSLVLAVPLIDTGYVLIRRIMEGKSPVWGDDKHLHHSLLKLGFSKSAIAFFYWGVTAVLGILSLQLKTLGKLYTIIGIAFILGGFILWLTYRQKYQKV